MPNDVFIITPAGISAANASTSGTQIRLTFQTFTLRLAGAIVYQDVVNSVSGTLDSTPTLGCDVELRVYANVPAFTYDSAEITANGVIFATCTYSVVQSKIATSSLIIHGQFKFVDTNIQINYINNTLSSATDCLEINSNPNGTALATGPTLMDVHEAIVAMPGQYYGGYQHYIKRDGNTWTPIGWAPTIRDISASCVTTNGVTRVTSLIASGPFPKRIDQTVPYQFMIGDDSLARWMTVVGVEFQPAGGEPTSVTYTLNGDASSWLNGTCAVTVWEDMRILHHRSEGIYPKLWRNDTSEAGSGMMRHSTSIEYPPPTVGYYLNQFNTATTGLGAKLQALEKATTPIGTIIAVATMNLASYTSVPGSVWMECSGTVLAKASYPDLYAIIGDSYNIPDYEIGTTSSGINSTLFKLPDLRGQFLRGYDPTGKYDHGNRAFNSTAPSVRIFGRAEFPHVGAHDHATLGDHGQIANRLVGDTYPGIATTTNGLDNIAIDVNGNYEMSLILSDNPVMSKGSAPPPDVPAGAVFSDNRPLNQTVTYLIKVRYATY